MIDARKPGLTMVPDFPALSLYEAAMTRVWQRLSGLSDDYEDRTRVEKLVGLHVLSCLHNVLSRPSPIRDPDRARYRLLRAITNYGRILTPEDSFNVLTSFAGDETDQVVGRKARPTMLQSFKSAVSSALALVNTARSRHEIFVHVTVQGSEQLVKKRHLLKSFSRRPLYAVWNVIAGPDSTTIFEMPLENELDLIVYVAINLLPVCYTHGIALTRSLASVYAQGTTVFHCSCQLGDPALSYAFMLGRVNLTGMPHGGAFHEFNNMLFEEVEKRGSNNYRSWGLTPEKFPALRYWKKQETPSGLLWTAGKRIYLKGSIMPLWLGLSDLMYSPRTHISPIVEELRDVERIAQASGFITKVHPKAGESSNDMPSRALANHPAEKFLHEASLVLLAEPGSSLFYYIIIHKIPFVIVVNRNHWDLTEHYLRLLTDLEKNGLCLNPSSLKELVSNAEFDERAWWKKIVSSEGYHALRGRFVDGFDQLVYEITDISVAMA